MKMFLHKLKLNFVKIKILHYQRRLHMVDFVSEARTLLPICTRSDTAYCCLATCNAPIPGRHVALHIHLLLLFKYYNTIII